MLQYVEILLIGEQSIQLLFVIVYKLVMFMWWNRYVFY